jgi:hypothetical protein
VVYIFCTNQMLAITAVPMTFARVTTIGFIRTSNSLTFGDEKPFIDVIDRGCMGKPYRRS